MNDPNRMQNVVVIGGGTGSYVTLSGLKEYSDKLNLTAIVTVADSGGSAKRERDEFGNLPVSDVRKALLALAKGNGERRQEVLRDLFTYRFDKGGSGLEGGTFGNLFLMVLTEILGSETAAIKEAEKILEVEGRVIPVALTTSNIVLEYANGQVIVGEHYLDEMLQLPIDGTQRVKKFYLLPPIQANPEAVQTIKQADWIIFPPGDLYGSIIVNLNVNGVAEAVRSSSAQLIYVVNLMTKYGQTHGFKASDHVSELEKYLGRKLDAILMHKGKLPTQILDLYEEEKDFPVKDDLRDDPRVIRTNLAADEVFEATESDDIKRSFIRHDPHKLAETLLKVISIAEVKST